ncbi:hypothetical protein GPALN_013164 [Globodera pallida]|nr:hypothetical protein GPALN_013164 [Globodera pallida]
MFFLIKQRIRAAFARFGYVQIALPLDIGSSRNGADGEAEHGLLQGGGGVFKITVPPDYNNVTSVDETTKEWSFVNGEQLLDWRELRTLCDEHLLSGDCRTAAFWTEKLLALSSGRTLNERLPDIAHYLSVLTAAQFWQTIIMLTNGTISSPNIWCSLSFTSMHSSIGSCFGDHCIPRQRLFVRMTRTETNLFAPFKALGVICSSMPPAWAPPVSTRAHFHDGHVLCALDNVVVAYGLGRRLQRRASTLRCFANKTLVAVIRNRTIERRLFVDGGPPKLLLSLADSRWWWTVPTASTCSMCAVGNRWSVWTARRSLTSPPLSSRRSGRTNAFVEFVQWSADPRVSRQRHVQRAHHRVGTVPAVDVIGRKRGGLNERQLLVQLSTAHSAKITWFHFVLGQPYLISADEDNRIVKWFFRSEVALPEIDTALEGHSEPVTALRFCAENLVVSTGREVGTAMCVNTGTGEKSGGSVHFGLAREKRFEPASWMCSTGHVDVWNMQSGRWKYELQHKATTGAAGPRRCGHRVVLDLTSRHLVTSSDDGLIHRCLRSDYVAAKWACWTFCAGRIARRFFHSSCIGWPQNARLTGLAFSSNGKRLMSADNLGFLKVWHLVTGSLIDGMRCAAPCVGAAIAAITALLGTAPIIGEDPQQEVGEEVEAVVQGHGAHDDSEDQQSQAGEEEEVEKRIENVEKEEMKQDDRERAILIDEEEEDGVASLSTLSLEVGAELPERPQLDPSLYTRPDWRPRVGQDCLTWSTFDDGTNRRSRPRSSRRHHSFCPLLAQ